MGPVWQILSGCRTGLDKISFQLWKFPSMPETLNILYFYFSLKSFHEPLCLIAHTSPMLTHDLASESWVSQLHMLMGKSGDKKSGRESLVLKCYPIVWTSWCGELKLSWVLAQLPTAPVKFCVGLFLDFGLNWDSQHLSIPISQKSWRKETELGTLELELLDVISGPKEMFYAIILKSTFGGFCISSLYEDLRFLLFHTEAHFFSPKFQITGREELCFPRGFK